MNRESVDYSNRNGRIFQINISEGGVPKRAISQTEITSRGLLGDKQAHTNVHGGTDKAICIYSLERILSLQGEGHPIYPGAAGENLTISGIKWVLIVPGVHMRFNRDVILEVTSFTAPCDALVNFFLGGDFSRISQNRHPGWSRVYARVIRPGSVSIGDIVSLEA